MDRPRENYSRKRSAILDVLRRAGTHPTADWVYTQLKPQYPDLSLGTVYRNLNRFIQTGQAVSLGVINGYERFDADTSPHSHLLCTRCGAVVDVFENPVGPSQLEEISRQTGCKIEAVSVRFQGLCPRCAREEGEDHGTEED